MNFSFQFNCYLITSLLLFLKNPDGAHAITIGKWGELPEQLAIVGGNCSIHGFNKKSEDILWTVTGDNVSSLALLDFNSDGYNEVCNMFLLFFFI